MTFTGTTERLDVLHTTCSDGVVVNFQESGKKVVPQKNGALATNTDDIPIDEHETSAVYKR